MLATPGSHLGTGTTICNNWSLWDDDTPLKRDAIKSYGIAHADDISGLIRAWSAALEAGQNFDPVTHCERYHEHWQKMGTNSLKAGG